MGQRGPLPKPTARKRLEGNPGHRPLPTDEPEPRTLEYVPSPPDWLPERAKQAWRVIAAELCAAEMLVMLDLQILELYSVSYHNWREMFDAVLRDGYTQEFFDKHGNLKYAQATPSATLLGKFAQDVNKFAKVLGLGPAYRVGLRIGDRDGGGKPVDPIEALLAGVGVSMADSNPPPKRKQAAKTSAKKAAPQKKGKRATKGTTKKTFKPAKKTNEKPEA